MNEKEQVLSLYEISLGDNGSLVAGISEDYESEPEGSLVCTIQVIL